MPILRGIRSSFVVLCVLGSLTGIKATDGFAQEPRQARPKAHRKWTAGPLKTDEFKAPPDPRSRLAAATTAFIRFSFEYRFRRDSRGIIVRLDEYNIFSDFIPDKSWMLPRQGKRLLDHEQGHFDLMEIYARKFEKDALALKTQSFRAQSEQEGSAMIKKKLDEALDKQLAACEDAQREYDYQTKHGLNAAAQSLHRRKQEEELEDLADELTRLRKRRR